MSGPRFVRFYPSDWRSGCIGMTFEQEGFYIRVCAFIYEANRRLPLNDSEAAKLIGANTNAYRKLKGQLVELGKLKRTADGYTVPRAEKELASVAYAKREQERPADPVRGRDTRQDTLTDTHKDAGEDTPHDTPLEFSEKPQEIKGPLKSHSQNHNQSQNNNSHQPSELVAAQGMDGRQDDPFFVKCKTALNGTTERAIEIVRQADGVYGTRSGAAQWLAELIDDTSADAVIQGIRFLEAKRERREPIFNAKSMIAKTAQTAKANAAEPKPSKAQATSDAWKIAREIDRQKAREKALARASL